MKILPAALTLLLFFLLTACSREPVTGKSNGEVKTPAAVAVSEIEIDPVTGFRMNGDWELVRAHCTGCHSSKLVTQQRGTAQQWLAMIRWMQEKQNLWQFDTGTEERIIAYLSENYPPNAARRRAAIPRDLMPPNPYSGQAASLN